MDLSRWSLEKFTRFSDRYRSFQEFLGDVLDGERGYLNEDQAPNVKELPFVVRDDIHRLLEFDSSSRGFRNRNPVDSFQRLSPFFEAGFLLKCGSVYSSSDPVIEARLIGMFLFGQIFVPPDRDGSVVPLIPPRISRDQVVKGRVAPVLNALQLEGIQELREASVFAFSPEENLSILLVCNRPGPWQVGIIESTHLVINELFDRASEKSSVRSVANALKASVRGLFK